MRLSLVFHSFYLIRILSEGSLGEILDIQGYGAWITDFEVSLSILVDLEFSGIPLSPLSSLNYVLFGTSG